jgi:radical SAM superfamily enzyme YgiQ (UPF0313 family)
MRFAKIIVANPPSPPGYEANKDSHGGLGQLYAKGSPVMPPLDFPYLASYLAARALPVEVVEAQGLRLTGQQFVRRLAEAAGAEPAALTLVVARTSAPTLDGDLALLSSAKEKATHLAIAVYGPVVQHVRNRLRREASLDYVLDGEPDEAVAELAAGRAEAEILGLSYRRGPGWAETPSRPFHKDLDRLPFPGWELLPYKEYTLPRSSLRRAAPYLPMLTSRGCPFGCQYCPYPIGQGERWRFRSPANVVEEIEHLVRRLGIEHIIFRDPMFSMRQDRVVAICDEIRRRGLSFRWNCETRVDCLNEETLRAMKAAGCEGINFGVESAEVAIQANSGRKPIAQEKFLAMVALCRRLKIRTFAFFLVGLPGDTVETVLETIGFALRLQPDWVQFLAVSPLVGTPLRQWAVERGLVPEDEYAYVNSHEATIGNENLTKEQVAALLRFAKFFERYLLNRGGILKDENRKDFLYRSGRALADIVAGVTARTLFAIRRNHFRRPSLRSA